MEEKNDFGVPTLTLCLDWSKRRWKNEKYVKRGKIFFTLTRYVILNEINVHGDKHGCPFPSQKPFKFIITLDEIDIKYL